MRSAQADTASKPASKTHLSTVEPIFSNKKHIQICKHILSLFFLFFSFSSFTFCSLLLWFESFNPRLWGPDWAFKQLRVKPSNPGLNKNSTQWTKAVGFRKTSPKNHRFTQLSCNHTWQVLSSLQWNVNLRWDQIELPPTPPRGHAPQWRLKWLKPFQWNWDIFLTFKDDVLNGRKSPVI